MTVKRKILCSVVIFVAILGALAAVRGVSDFVLLLPHIIHDSMFPETISWDAKNAYLKCPGVIADPRQWPAKPADACEAMYLCVNEGALSESQMTALDEQIRNTPGCEKP